jgi:arabinan endo-1,5-alpha-L-arabinosidase
VVAWHGKIGGDNRAVAVAAVCLLAALSHPCFAQGPLTGSVGIHDPSRILKLDGRYYVFGTGDFIVSKSSANLKHWNSGPTVFSSVPTWTRAAVPGFNSTFWAPDVVHVNDKYHLYYSVSTFGSQVSAIGLATSPTLNPADPNYGWSDQGMVIQSQVGSPYNTIDPGIFLNTDGRMWMTFGSYWNGIYLTELDPTTGKRKSPSTSPFRLAYNPAGAHAIEAPYLHREGDYYYLFVNYDRCCAGVNSTYNIRVGRSTSVAGPFRDKNGTLMTNGGGSMFLETEANIIGPGHFSIVEEQGVEFFSYHYYDGNASGAAKLNLRTLAWTPDGWPVIADTLPAADFNADGVVDGLDLPLWAAAYGVDGSATADADYDTDGRDFLLWQRTIGAGAADPTAFLAPEPVGTSIAFGLAAAFAHRCHRRSRMAPAPRPPRHSRGHEDATLNRRTASSLRTACCFRNVGSRLVQS